MINNKLEEKTCGDGPSIATMFSDDKDMQTLIENVQVHIRLSSQSHAIYLLIILAYISAYQLQTGNFGFQDTVYFAT